MSFINILTDYNGVFSLVGVLILLTLVYYQLLQSKKLVSGYKDYLEQAELRVNKEASEIRNAKINTALLILAEMKENAYYMASFLYFFQKRSPEIRVFKATMSDPSTVSDKIWRVLSLDASRYFSKEVMQELVTYYTGITELRMGGNRTLEEWADLTKRQLIAYQNSIEILESEVGFAFTAARGEVFEVNGVKLRLNRHTGDVQ